ncbi:MAG: acylphosphatase [Actinobacteria bacterium]|nr:acylphosphatase [Actinomycetota bacterium]
MVAKRVVVSGKVQGVFFRASTRRCASEHGVTGWVRNDPDGTVTAHLEGDPDGVHGVLGWIRAGGPPAARVDDVTVADAEESGATGFQVRRS